MAGSMLNAIGVRDLVASSVEDYENIATELGRDVKKLAELRKLIRKALDTNPVCDPKNYMKDLESLLESVAA
jgi:predicted O-linked N-acetylglucosamine transferase (SPINDLY family)